MFLSLSPACSLRITMLTTHHRLADAYRFKNHWQNQHAQVKTQDNNVCPDPSCASLKAMSAYDFHYHLIVHHRLPVCGSGKKVDIVALKLQDPDDFVVEDADSGVDEASPPPRNKRKRPVSKKHRDDEDGGEDEQREDSEGGDEAEQE